MMIRCLIVDDSPTFRGALRGILARTHAVTVVGEAGDGEEAIARAKQLKPDVITMDVRMPRRDGLDAIKEIMQVSPTPIIVVSGAADDEGVSFQALKLGAIEVLEKPRLDSPRYETQAEAIRQAVQAVAGLTLVTRRRERSGRPELPEREAPRPSVCARKVPACIGIVSSTGGPPALQRVFSALPADFPVPILVVQHIAGGFCEGLVRWLASQCALKVRVAKRGETPEPGVVLFAPDEHHMMVSMGRIRLDDSAPVKGLRPCGNVLLTSLAREYGDLGAGFVLTGMGDDGAAGLKLMREQGAFTAAQGKASSVVFGMPEVALRLGAAELSLEIDEIPEVMLKLSGRGAKEAEPVAAPSTRRKKLLLADDAETILQLEQVLLSDSYELVLAHNGKEALDQAQLHRPDGILLDHSMPVMTGAQVLAELRASPCLRAVPVIMVSSETDKDIVQSWWKNGCNAVVPKPIDGTLLVGTVRKHVQSSS
jgi:two-component system, chemotaxis family, protein-glutamate methylesterase/glutaminase